MMKSFSSIFLVLIVGVCVSCSKKNVPDGFVLVKGGVLKNTNIFGKELKVRDFYMSKYEVTQKQWIDIMGYNPSQFIGDSLPVEMVSWYECIEYCNKKSLKEGLAPYYNIDKLPKDLKNFSEFDSIRWHVTINSEANGYRLPTEVEWEYAAKGGERSNNYLYAGSNNIDEVAWYWRNSGDSILTGYWVWIHLLQNKNRTHIVGTKKPNELGLYDMSGNVREWVWDIDEPKSIDDFKGRIWKGGGWMGGEFTNEVNFKGKLDPAGKGPDQGFRICRNK